MTTPTDLNTYCRPEVALFAKRMEDYLRATNPASLWKEKPPISFFAGLKSTQQDLLISVASEEAWEKICDLSVKCASIHMMISHKYFLENAWKQCPSQLLTPGITWDSENEK